MRKQISIKKNLEVSIPQLPNFIICGDMSIPVSHFSVQELRAIGKEWTDRLIEKSKREPNL